MTVDRTKLIAFGVAALLAVVVYALWPKEKDDPESLIQRKVIAMARAAEKKDMGFVNEQISETFHSGSGLGKQEIKGFLAGQILRGTWVRVFVENIRVTVNGDTAKMSGKFILGRSNAPTLKELPREGVMGAYRIDADVKREPDGEWRFTSASWNEESVF